MPDLFSKPNEDTGLYAVVAPDRAADTADAFTYIVPAHLHATLRVGDRVRVPLGRASAPTDATVIDLSPSTPLPIHRLKPVSEQKGTRLPFPLIDLAKWIARYYATPIGSVLATIVPTAVTRQTGKRTLPAYRRTNNTPQPNAPKLPPTARAAWDAIQQLDPAHFPLDKSTLIERLELKSAAPLNRLAKLGLLEHTTIDLVRARHTPTPTTPPEDPTRHLPLTPDQAHAVHAIAQSRDTFAPHLLMGVTGSGKTEVYLRALQACIDDNKGAIVLVPEIALTPQTASRFVARFGPERVAVLHSGLTPAQRNLEWTRIAKGQARIAIGARSAIFAPFPPAPPDTQDDATPTGATLTRPDTQEHAKGQTPSGGGVGLIIVDEEHDSSYKQDSAPRYHARDVAIKRAQLERCPVVLGSATPSLESYRNARAGKHTLLSLPSRVHDGPMPRVRVVDLNEERRQREGDRRSLTALGPTLRGALADTLDRHEQAILLLNRRGYASFIACASPDCTFTLTCEHCDAHLVYHRPHLPSGARASFVKCHHCLEMNRLPTTCPDSGHKLALLGFGTQRLEDELADAFPQLTEPDALLRLDSDTMRRAADYHHALDSFRNGTTRVILGTQMIAKGLDFPNVSLVGVVNADTSLSIPDFRASERTFQLVAQVAGRAGRAAHTARSAQVIVQTIDPDHPAITHAANHDYTAFAEEELRTRAAARPPLPPVGRMARVVFKHADHAKAHAMGASARREADHIARQLLAENPRDHLTVRGPFDAPIARIAGKHRVVLELQAHTTTPIQRCLAHLRATKTANAGASTVIDTDPISLL